MTKLERIDADIQKAKTKVLEFQSKVKELEQQKTVEENALIVQMVRKVKLTPDELERFLQRHKHTLTNPTKTPPVMAATYNERKEQINEDTSEA